MPQTMLTTNNGNSLKVLITRPTKKTKALAESLAAINIASVSQPLFDYQPLADLQISKRLLTNRDIVIFVSVAAVEFAHQTFTAKNWRFEHIIAVGRATKATLSQLGINKVISPEQENSEGLLTLPELNKKFNGEQITIVRGNSGREHLAEQLIHQGAKVTYLESYQRVWRTFTEDISKQWFKQQINCIVITSNTILEKIVQLICAPKEQHGAQQLTEYWKNQCSWVVVSERIANTARQFGLTHVIISDGASENAIIMALKSLESKKLRCNI
jgi:uroporphyrinogen-III synthase